MGLGVGIITIEILEQPDGLAYEFAQELAALCEPNAYMFGPGGSWIPLTERDALMKLNEFAKQRGLSTEERHEVREWLRSLPWQGKDNPRSPHGGGIELYFNW